MHVWGGMKAASRTGFRSWFKEQTFAERSDRHGFQRHIHDADAQVTEVECMTAEEAIEVKDEDDGED